MTMEAKEIVTNFVYCLASASIESMRAKMQ